MPLRHSNVPFSPGPRFLRSHLRVGDVQLTRGCVAVRRRKAAAPGLYRTAWWQGAIRVNGAALLSYAYGFEVRTPKLTQHHIGGQCLQ
jgi:hypothetical protein